MTPGDVVDGRFRLLSLLGRGGMGSVFRAERLGWGSEVAIKLMNLSSADDPQAVERFQREARSAARLRSLHVVQVLDDGIDEASGAPFIVMELLEGETLAERLQRLHRLSPEETVRIVRDVARALGRAHALGMIHRDLKPDNVFLVANDDLEIAKVLDFGIAKWTRDAHRHQTETGQVLGTVAYMSPEQIKSARNIDHRADLWSLGVIACECITGHKPFVADNVVGVALAICSRAPPRPSELGRSPAGFDGWFARAVAPDLDRRFDSAKAMADELERALSSTPPEPVQDARRAATLLFPVPGARPAHDATERDLVLELDRRVERRTSRLADDLDDAAVARRSSTPSSGPESWPRVPSSERPAEARSGLARGLRLGVASLLVFAAAGASWWAGSVTDPPLADRVEQLRSAVSGYLDRVRPTRAEPPLGQP